MNVFTDRIPYSPITSRPRLAWPDGARIAVMVVPNVEFYDYLPPPSPHRDPWPRVPHPDVLGYGSRDYGNRVGLWRLFEVLDRHRVRATVSFNLAVCDHLPEVLKACEERGYDTMGHGLYNTRYSYGLAEADERAMVADCVATFRRHTGRQLQGWLSPALTFTLNTPDIVAEAGIRYICDFLHDDQPFPIRVRKGRLITLPYSMDVNDAVLVRQGHEGEEFARMIVDSFDTLHREGAAGGRVLAIPVHPYIGGQPHWIGHLDRALAHIRARDGVWWATGAEIANWYYENAYDAVAASLSGRG